MPICSSYDGVVQEFKDCNADVLVRDKRYDSTLLVANKLRPAEKPILDSVRKEIGLRAKQIQVFIERGLLVESTAQQILWREFFGLWNNGKLGKSSACSLLWLPRSRLCDSRC